MIPYNLTRKAYEPLAETCVIFPEKLLGKDLYKGSFIEKMKRIIEIKHPAKGILTQEILEYITSFCSDK